MVGWMRAYFHDSHYLLTLVLLAGCLTGCQGLTVSTNSRVKVDGPVQATGRVQIDVSPLTTSNRVIVDVPPINDGGPLMPTPLARPSRLGRTTTQKEPNAPNTPTAQVTQAEGCSSSDARIAVIDVDGLILNRDFTGPYSLGDNPVAVFRERLEKAEADPQVKAVVVRINSPGGSVTATDILWHELQSFRQRTRLPVVACLMDTAAGGGYYLATAADVIVAHPTTITGGIGVIFNAFNLHDLLNQFNIQPQEIKSGLNIDLGSPIRNIPEAGRQLLQEMAQEYHERFKEIVRRSRPGLNAADPTNFDGRVFTARLALERKLIDQIGYLDDALQLACERGGCPGAVPVMYRRPNDPGRTIYAVSPNTPLQASLLPISIPGLDRSKLPAFLYLWQAETGMERLSGR